MELDKSPMRNDAAQTYDRRLLGSLHDECDAEMVSARVKVGVTRKSYTSSAGRVLFNS